MKITELIAEHMKQVHKGGNWTVTNLQETLSDISIEESQKQVGDLNSIAVLTFHINYFVKVAIMYLETGILKGDDKLSFNPPSFESESQWKEYIHGVVKDGEHLSELITKVDDNLLQQGFGDKKYGNHFRNLIGIIEHTHYHLGQIALLKKILRAS